MKNEKQINFNMVLFSHMDRLSLVAGNLGDSKGIYLSGASLEVYRAQLMHLESLIVPYLGKKYAEKAKTIKAEVISASTKADVHFFAKCQTWFQLLMSEVYNARFMQETRTEDAEEFDDQTDSSSD